LIYEKRGKESRGKTDLIKVLLPLVFLLMLTASGCGRRQENDKSGSKPPNADILDEVNRAQTWFHAKKIRPIWARVIEADQSVKTIEGAEKVKVGDYLCRGEAGDIWPQTAKSLDEKYQKTAEIDAEGWHKYIPRPDNQGVMATQVQHAFAVRAKWGLLSGKVGDYIVKNFSDRDVAYPDDVWIVDQKLFHATYQAVTAEK
jgi:hypothetical protein